MGTIYLSHHATLWHNAGKKNNTNEYEMPIRDNGVATAKIGLDLSDRSFLDSLDISGGGILAFDRLRGVYDWRIPKGFITDLYAGYRQFYIDNRQEECRGGKG